MPTRIPTTHDPATAPFVPNGFYERLLEVRRTRPQDFAVLSPATQLALGHYEAAKRRAALLAADDTESGQPVKGQVDESIANR